MGSLEHQKVQNPRGKGAKSGTISDRTPMAGQEREDGLYAASQPAPARRPERQLLRLGDGYTTSVYVHSARGEVGRLPVLYVHGIQSHCGWYVASASALADRGHDVFQVTRRGSGDNEADRGHAGSAGQLLDDLDAACEFALEQTGADRLALLGVSWGGKLAAACAADPRRARRIASLTLAAPGIAPRVDVSAATKIAVACCVLVAPRRAFDIPLGDVELFTDNETMRRYLRDDPLQLHQATARFMLASRSLDRRLRRAPRGAVSAPTTLILADRDRIIDNDATRRAVDRLTAGRATIEELPGCHTLEFEPDTGRFFAVLSDAVLRGQ